MVKSEENTEKVEVIDGKLLSVFREHGVEFFPDLGNYMYCPTAEPYWTVVSLGIKVEGSKARLCKTEDEALDAWNSTTKRIIAELDGKLTVYWRKMPEMRHFDAKRGKGAGWTVYSRFRISNLPVVQDADYEKLGADDDHREI